MVELREKKNFFKKHSIFFVIFQVILIALSVILSYFRDTDIGIPNFSMDKLFILVSAFTVIFGVLVCGYLLNGLFRYNIVKTSFIKRINYKVLGVILLIMMIFGASCFFTQLYLVGGKLTDLTWGSLILGIVGLEILGITLIVGIFWIIDEIKAEL